MSISLASGPLWRTSTFCNNGNCVEVADLSGKRVGVRDNKDPNSPVLEFSGSEWANFIGRIKKNE